MEFQDTEKTEMRETNEKWKRGKIQMTLFGHIVDIS